MKTKIVLLCALLVALLMPAVSAQASTVPGGGGKDSCYTLITNVARVSGGRIHGLFHLKCNTQEPRTLWVAGFITRRDGSHQAEESNVCVYDQGVHSCAVWVTIADPPTHDTYDFGFDPEYTYIAGYKAVGRAGCVVLHCEIETYHF